MDGENNGTPYEKIDDLGGKNHYFWKHPNGCPTSFIPSPGLGPSFSREVGDAYRAARREEAATGGGLPGSVFFRGGGRVMFGDKERKI